MENNITTMLVRVGGDDGLVLKLKGRVAWAVSNLIAAGENGCTPITHVGPRWSDYVMKARRMGLDIETIHEAHSGPYAGHHARYVLRSPVEVIDQEMAHG